MASDVATEVVEDLDGIGFGAILDTMERFEWPSVRDWGACVVVNVDCDC